MEMTLVKGWGCESCDEVVRVDDVRDLIVGLEAK